jgi:hypothetical protein
MLYIYRRMLTDAISSNVSGGGRKQAGRQTASLLLAFALLLALHHNRPLAFEVVGRKLADTVPQVSVFVLLYESKASKMSTWVVDSSGSTQNSTSKASKTSTFVRVKQVK